MSFIILTIIFGIVIIISIMSIMGLAALADRRKKKQQRQEVLDLAASIDKQRHEDAYKWVEWLKERNVNAVYYEGEKLIRIMTKDANTKKKAACQNSDSETRWPNEKQESV